MKVQNNIISSYQYEFLMKKGANHIMKIKVLNLRDSITCELGDRKVYFLPQGYSEWDQDEWNFFKTKIPNIDLHIKVRTIREMKLEND